MINDKKSEKQNVNKYNSEKVNYSIPWDIKDPFEIDWDNLGETSVEYNDESRTVDGEDTGDFDNYWNQEGVFEEATDQFNEFL